MTRRLLFLILSLLPLTAGAVTIRNDDSCDISQLPAATLLLPYFEVDIDNRNGETTLFTLTNVTNLDQIARVTLWTDASYPVLTFNVYLTGYDVQSINLFDMIARGIIAPDGGTGTAVTKRGSFSDRNTSLELTDCDRLPGALDPIYVQRMQRAFLLGSVPDLGTLPGCAYVGATHENAVGYATIDVVQRCSTNNPADAKYWTEDIGYNNVLTGDYQQVNRQQNFAQGGPLVHIRAIPEGGTAASRLPLLGKVSVFERTFYARYQEAATPNLDGRQPLPAAFSTRWISGIGSDYQTSMKIWRETRRNHDLRCVDYRQEQPLRVGEMVVFDENENAVGLAGAVPAPGLVVRPQLPATSRTSIGDSDIYPQMAHGQSSGWIYMNLDHTRGDGIASQNWVIASMRAAGRFSTDIDAIALGNGCSTASETSAASIAGGGPIAPAENDSGPSSVIATTNNDDSCDIALLPAATLLLPYFEVDLVNRAGEATLFTVTNVSPSDQIARVTLWTDYAYPVISFNVYLTGYDVQSINLFDVIARGIIAPDEGTGTRVTARGPLSARNAVLDLSACRNLPGALPAQTIQRMQLAFTQGIVNDCNAVGNDHDNAVGYATVDVVRSCAPNMPTDAAYWTEDLLYDNVLIGDVQQVTASSNFAQGSPLVHVRAIPEGGTPQTREPSPFVRTFYSRYQPAGDPRRDGRQPLPATFAARWIQGSASEFQTTFKVWREGKNGSNPGCRDRRKDGGLSFIEIVRFDEAENAVADIPTSRVCAPIFIDSITPATSRTSVTDSAIYPQLTNGAVGGWMYLNLDNCDKDAHASSNWVTTSMRSEGRYSVDMDATALGNGCTRPVAESEVSRSQGIAIGPGANNP